MGTRILDVVGMKRYEKVLNLSRQTGNRWQAAGITAREAIQLYEMWKKMEKIRTKPKLWVSHEKDLEQARRRILRVLGMAGRLK